MTIHQPLTNYHEIKDNVEQYYYEQGIPYPGRDNIIDDRDVRPKSGLQRFLARYPKHYKRQYDEKQ